MKICGPQWHLFLSATFHLIIWRILNGLTYKNTYSSVVQVFDNISQMLLQSFKWAHDALDKGWEHAQGDVSRFHESVSSDEGCGSWAWKLLSSTGLEFCPQTNFTVSYSLMEWPWTENGLTTSSPLQVCEDFFSFLHGQNRTYYGVFYKHRWQS